ncbi:hypothetical protein PanWU01x14_084300 [Parasponia andersonii]|uniref:Uncharacterized protein n=1 Tax=Parasponia andersonii TaxID=3476 RepID=A0A2P5D9L1_PARAD|nr:hypothetical protein PanWU01x14_084300 [Parasponia andersonii]
MKPMPLVSPRFDIGRSRNGPTKISPPARFFGYRSAVQPPFLTPPANTVSSHRCRLAPSGCLQNSSLCQDAGYLYYRGIIEL